MKLNCAVEEILYSSAAVLTDC